MPHRARHHTPHPADSRADSHSKRQVILHPVLFAAYPALFLYAQNFGFVNFQVILRPLAVSLVSAVVLWWLLARRMGSMARAAPLVSLGFLGFFSFGAVQEISNRLAPNGTQMEVPVADGFALSCFVLVLLASGWFLKRRSSIDPWNYIMNVVSLALIAFPGVHITQMTLQTSAAAQTVSPATDIPRALAGDAGSQPDIYFILLDGYARADVLRDLYDFDNSPFLQTLRTLGFQVFEESTSNYSTTALSVASTLNLDYVDRLLGAEINWLSDWRFARELVVNSRISRFLGTRGYRTVAVSSQYFNVDFREADIYRNRWWFPAEFETLLLRKTPLPWLSARAGWPFLYEIHRQRNLFSLDQLQQTARLPGPKFVYTHLLCPHPPFVFGPSGEAVNPPRPYSWAEGLGFLSQPGATSEEYIAGYRGQVEFLNKVAPGIIRQILDNSASPPIIILQSDHGPALGLSAVRLDDPALRERFGVLNALYLPERSGALPPNDVSLVNTFRVVLNKYFGTGFELLPNRHFFVTEDRPYQYLPVTADLTPAQSGTDID